MPVSIPDQDEEKITVTKRAVMNIAVLLFVGGVSAVGTFIFWSGTTTSDFQSFKSQTMSRLEQVREDCQRTHERLRALEIHFASHVNRGIGAHSGSPVDPTVVTTEAADRRWPKYRVRMLP